jgi:hypothetical protein
MTKRSEANLSGTGSGSTASHSRRFRPYFLARARYAEVPLLDCLQRTRPCAPYAVTFRLTLWTLLEQRPYG